ncbi:cytochrome C [Sulfuricaulis limicola]|uniref:Cytochrome C n=1 Tax=Sulfuricaulis limicola TaxID=1620215 RepID=A0A1B4XJC6_9GAMM|nr:c-type cytochrome [Sulfuricaulis limicola]BAV34909.1 cytochrome C [Sulfuricaulis limicola]
MKSHKWLYPLLLPLVLFSLSAPAAEAPVDGKTFERGRYLIVAGGCNDCHTPGYPESNGKTPQAAWLAGNAVGFQGPWGTTYPANLRLTVQKLTEAQWLARARQPMRPPMPWFNLREMTDADLVAMYRFIRTLGPAGVPAPAAAAPGVAVMTPYIEFVPKNLPKHASR